MNSALSFISIQKTSSTFFTATPSYPLKICDSRQYKRDLHASPMPWRRCVFFSLLDPPDESKNLPRPPQKQKAPSQQPPPPSNFQNNDISITTQSDGNGISPNSSNSETIEGNVEASSNGTGRLHNLATSQVKDDVSSSISPVDSNAASTPEASGTIRLQVGSWSADVSARSLLYVVPFLWGSFAPSVRFLFAQHPHQDPAFFNSERLLLSTFAYFPIFIAEFRMLTDQSRKEESSTTNSDDGVGRFAFFPAGIELGIYVFLSNIAQVLGLEQTSASRAAFLVQLQTVFVPILGTFLGVDSISFINGLSSTIAVAGVALLSSDKGHGVTSSLTGDALEVLSAIFFSAYIVRLGKIVQRIPPNPLVATKIAVQAILSLGWAAATEFLMVWHHPPQNISVHADIVSLDVWTASAIAINAAIVIWTGLFPSALAGWIQTKGQQGVPPSEAALIFATQPLWATAIAAIVLGESFGVRGLSGGGLIIIATMIPSLSKSIPFLQRFDKSQKDDR